MNQKQLVFDYQSGTIRRDFLNEGPKQIVKVTNKKETNNGVVATVLNLFGRK